MNKIEPKHIFIFIAIGFLYFAGVAAIVYPMISNVYSLRMARTVIADYAQVVEEMDTSAIDEIFERAAEHNMHLVEHNYDDGMERTLCNEDGLMCYIEIPSISVYLPVYYGTTDEVLAKGCGMLENTSLPIGGASTHSVLSAHTGLPSAEMFTKLDQVKMNDLFYIHVLGRVLTYKVNKIKVVFPVKVEELAIMNEKDYITLLTCTPYGINDKRLLVRGTRVPDEAETEDTDAPSEQDVDHAAVDDSLTDEIDSQMTVIYIVLGVAVALYIAAFLWMMISLGSKETKDAEEQDVTQETN